MKCVFDVAAIFKLMGIDELKGEYTSNSNDS